MMRANIARERGRGASRETVRSGHYWLARAELAPLTCLDFLDQTRRFGVCPLRQKGTTEVPGNASGQVYNKMIRKFRRRAAFSAFMFRISPAELEARLETYARLYAALSVKPD
jgi:hypothetical protein